MENNGYVIAPFDTKPVNKHDSELFPQAFENLFDWADLIGFQDDLVDGYFNLDSAFDSASIKDLISDFKMKPVIYPNRRNTKDPKKIEAMFSNFPKEIYKHRFKVERTFAWKTKFKRLNLRFEFLPETFNGFRYLAYSMINFRKFFNNFK